MRKGLRSIANLQPLFAPTSSDRTSVFIPPHRSAIKSRPGLLCLQVLTKIPNSGIRIEALFPMAEPCVSLFEDDIRYDALCQFEAILGWMVRGGNQASDS